MDISYLYLQNAVALHELPRNFLLPAEQLDDARLLIATLAGSADPDATTFAPSQDPRGEWAELLTDLKAGGRLKPFHVALLAFAVALYLQQMEDHPTRPLPLLQRVFGLSVAVNSALTFDTVGAVRLCALGNEVRTQFQVRI